MSIRQQVSDAELLAKNGRYEGALTHLLLAVAASSRKRFPKGTESLAKPGQVMLDGEAFAAFLGGRIRTLLFGTGSGPDYGGSGIEVTFRNRRHDLAYVLYKFYRCELTHEGQLPTDVRFVPSADSDRASLRVSIGTGDEMVLDHGWIQLLINAVVLARCNAAEFGIEHWDLLPNPGVDALAFEKTMLAKHELRRRPSFRNLRRAVELISPATIMAADDTQLSERFDELVQTGQIVGGAVTGLWHCGATEESGRILPKGIAVLRDIAATHSLVRFSEQAK